MKKFLISTILAGTLSLGGCASTGGVPTPGGTDVLLQAQQLAVQLCGWKEPVTNIANIILAMAFPAGLPLSQIENQFATAVCNVVTSRSVRLGSTVPAVAGIPLMGGYVVEKGRFRQRSSAEWPVRPVRNS